jgi:hypothetical protein
VIREGTMANAEILALKRPAIPFCEWQSLNAMSRAESFRQPNAATNR